jgi:DNA-binding NarL/FixJ family response regulator
MRKRGEIFMLLQILVAEEERSTRENVRNILQAVEGWAICAEVDNAKEAIESVRKHKPHVALLDLSRTNGDNLEVARHIRTLRPETEIIVVFHDEHPDIDKSIRAGIFGCLFSKDMEMELVSAIDAVQHGKLYLPPTVRARTSWPIAEPNIVGESAPDTPLTGREIQVLRLVAQGYSSKETAQFLSISVKTVESHRTRIMRKLGKHSVVELVHYAIRHKIVGT